MPMKMVVMRVNPLIGGINAIIAIVELMSPPPKEIENKG